MTDNGEVNVLRRGPSRAKRIVAILVGNIRRLSQVGFGRHTAVPALRRVADSSAVSFSRQLISLLTGSSLIGIGIALLVHGDLGLPPNDVLSSALSTRLGLTLGQTGWATASVLFLVASLLGRRPSLWGIGYIVANGAAIDAASGLLTQPDTLAGRWAFVIAAIALLPSGVSLVVYSGTTGGPFELLMLAGEDRGVSRVAIRYGLEIGVFAGGIILGGSFGPATVVYALTIGLVLRWIGQALVDHGIGRRARLESRQQRSGMGPKSKTLGSERKESSIDLDQSDKRTEKTLLGQDSSSANESRLHSAELQAPKPFSAKIRGTRSRTAKRQTAKTGS